MTILDKIAARRREDIDRLKISLPQESFADSLDYLPPSRFKAAISDSGKVNIIAEIKKGSPSKGILRKDFYPARLARAYRDGGAAALSVLTESEHFYGSFENLESAKTSSGLPVLCKDFVVDQYQIFHARYRGADAVLLIVALHKPANLARHIQLAAQIGIDCLVEVHDVEELKIALEAGAQIIGVNNRNLNDFSVNLDTSEQLAAEIPPDIIKVSESGINSYEDISRLRGVGFSAFLIGEALVTSKDPARLMRSMRGVR